ncbi:hypothetical protein P5V15_014676 [Pogonomyrmex californicus]
MGAYNCKKLHETGTVALGNAVVDRLMINATNRRNVTLAGSAHSDGRCAEAQYIDGYEIWEDVVVQAAVKITLRTFTTPLKRSTDRITLNSGTQCVASQEGYNDYDGTETYWTIPPYDNCHFNPL